MYYYKDMPPFEGEKTIFLTTFSARGSSIIEDPKLKEVIKYGFFELGDGGSAASLYAGKFTFPELCNFIESLENEASTKEFDKAVEVVHVFEYKGWGYDPEDEDLYVILDAQEKIEKFLGGK